VRILFFGRDLLVTYTPGREKALCVVTFNEYRSDQRNIALWGEKVLRELGYGQIAVVPSWNHWYQTPEMEAVLPQIRTFLGPYAASATYGYSMGGFGALQFAEDVFARTVLAVSPQFSIDPAKTPWDPRWRQEARALSFAHDCIEAKYLPAETCVLYDPRLRPDRRHVRLLARHHRIRPLPCRGAGHNPVQELIRQGLHRLLPANMRAGHFDLPTFRIRRRIAVRAEREATGRALGGSP